MSPGEGGGEARDRRPRRGRNNPERSRIGERRSSPAANDAPRFSDFQRRRPPLVGEPARDVVGGRPLGRWKTGGLAFV